MRKCKAQNMMMIVVLALALSVAMPVALATPVAEEQDVHVLLIDSMYKSITYDESLGSLGERGYNIYDKYVDRFAEKHKIPEKNVNMLLCNEATHEKVQSEIQAIANKSDKNDLVILFIHGHGYTLGKDMQLLELADPQHTGRCTVMDDINQWLDTVVAKAIIVIVSTCGCDSEDAIEVWCTYTGAPRVVIMDIDPHNTNPEANWMFQCLLGLYYDEACDMDSNGRLSIGEMAEAIYKHQSYWVKYSPYLRGRLAIKKNLENYDIRHVAKELYFSDCKPGKSSGCDWTKINNFVKEQPTEPILPLSLKAATSKPTPTPPGFEAVFAIAGLLAVAYLVRRRKH